MNWTQAKERWLKEHAHKRDLKADLIKFKWLDKYLNGIEIKSITVESIEKIAEAKASYTAPATVNRLLSLIKSVLNDANKKWNVLESVPYIRLRKEPAGRTRWLDPDEVKKLANELPTHLKAMFLFAIASGQRTTNIRLLKWKDISFDRKSFVISGDSFKNGSTHFVPLNKLALRILEEQKGKHPEYVFTYEGRPVTRCSTEAWKKAKIRAGIEDFHFHDSRHTTASHLLMNGASLLDVSEILGHSSLDMTKRYSHLSKNHLISVSERLDSIKF